jgi:hypothetical protein
MCYVVISAAVGIVCLRTDKCDKHMIFTFIPLRIQHVPPPYRHGVREVEARHEPAAVAEPYLRVT